MDESLNSVAGELTIADDETQSPAIDQPHLIASAPATPISSSSASTPAPVTTLPCSTTTFLDPRTASIAPIWPTAGKNTRYNFPFIVCYSTSNLVYDSRKWKN